MKHTKLDIIKSWFKVDKQAFWWKTFTDYELQLSRMSLTELASELNRTRVRNEIGNTIIVEHILASRIARLQSRASWWSGWLSFAGAMLAAALTFYLGQQSVLSTNYTKNLSTPCEESETLHREKPLKPTISTLKQDAPEEINKKP